MNTTGKKKTLLIIDKDPANCREIRSLLADAYDFVELRTAGEGVRLLENSRASFSAVLLSADDNPEDLNLFYRLMREKLEFSAIPVLLLVPDPTDARGLDALGENAVDCISRPYHPTILKNRIANAIQFKDSVTLYGIEKMLKELPSNIYLKDREGRYIFATHYWHHLDHGDDPKGAKRGHPPR